MTHRYCPSVGLGAKNMNRLLGQVAQALEFTSELRVFLSSPLHGSRAVERDCDCVRAVSRRLLQELPGEQRVLHGVSREGGRAWARLPRMR